MSPADVADVPSVRGDADAIVLIHDQIAAADDAAAAAAALSAAGTGGDLAAEPEILEAVRLALRAPLLTVELSIAGPGGREDHRLEAGVNGAVVRTSIAREDLAELSVTPFPALIGLLTRLLRFGPGDAPAPGASPVRLEIEDLAVLGAAEQSERRGAFARISPHLRQAVGDVPEDCPWVIVQTRGTWTAVGGHEEELTGACVRVGQTWLVVDAEADQAVLTPVTSMAAWERLMHVLPGEHDVQTPTHR